MKPDEQLWQAVKTARRTKISAFANYEEAPLATFQFVGPAERSLQSLRDLHQEAP